MWIQSTRDAHAGGQFKDERVHELNDGAAVSFSASGTAQVSAEVGDYLTSTYDVFEATDDGDADAELDDDTDESGDDQDQDQATTVDVADDDDDDSTDSDS